MEEIKDRAAQREVGEISALLERVHEQINRSEAIQRWVEEELGYIRQRIENLKKCYPELAEKIDTLLKDPALEGEVRP